LSALFSAKDVGELSDTSTAIFHRLADEAPLSIDVPIVKAVLLELADCAPDSVEFDELVRRGQERLGRVQDSDAEEAGTNLLASATRDFIEISTGPRFFTMTVSDRPRVTEVTRRDVRESRYATNLLFQHVAVEPFEQHLLRLCDGAHTHEEMAKKLTVEIDEGLLDVEWKGPRLKGNPDVETIVLSIVKSRLKKLARQGLLLA
jgi:methyltransferase-like protein